MDTIKQDADLGIYQALKRGYGIFKNQYTDREKVKLILFKNTKKIRYFWADTGKERPSFKVYFLRPLVEPRSTLELVPEYTTKGDFRGYRWAIEHKNAFTERLVSELCKNKQECIEAIHKIEGKINE